MSIKKKSIFIIAATLLAVGVVYDCSASDFLSEKGLPKEYETASKSSAYIKAVLAGFVDVTGDSDAVKYVHLVEPEWNPLTRKELDDFIIWADYHISQVKYKINVFDCNSFASLWRTAASLYFRKTGANPAFYSFSFNSVKDGVRIGHAMNLAVMSDGSIKFVDYGHVYESYEEFTAEYGTIVKIYNVEAF